MTLPNYFQTSNPATVNLDYFDYISKTGYKNYFGVVTKDNSSVKYKIVPNFISPHTSYRKSSSVAFTNNSPAAAFIDYDFDLAFTNTATIKGEAAVAFTYSHLTGGAGEQSNIHVEVNFYHVNSGGTETSIGQGLSEVVQYNSNTQRSWRRLVFATLSKKKFINGEKLRVNIKLMGFMTAGAGTGTTIFYHDPDNTTSSSFMFADFTDTTLYNNSNVIMTIPFVTLL